MGPVGGPLCGPLCITWTPEGSRRLKYSLSLSACCSHWYPLPSKQWSLVCVCLSEITLDSLLMVTSKLLSRFQVIHQPLFCFFISLPERSSLFQVCQFKRAYQVTARENLKIGLKTYISQQANNKKYNSININFNWQRSEESDEYRMNCSDSTYRTCWWRCWWWCWCKFWTLGNIPTSCNFCRQSYNSLMIFKSL